LIVVDVLIVIGIVAIYISSRRRRDNAGKNLHLHNPAPGRWKWSLASEEKQPAMDAAKEAEDKEASAQPASRQERIDAPVCSLCGAPMVPRTANKGEHAGKPFYGCSTFPKCRNTAQYISMRDTKLMKSMLK